MATEEKRVTRLLILVQGNRAPQVLGPMSEEMRLETFRDLRQRYADCTLHLLDLRVRRSGKLTVKVA